ncbi:MAG TPA: lasso peptide biosynthesis PqqD family chaperone [Gemmatimonadaceae bacterium]|nr:lasso peptide biosynthesis PqqD family chaperone [Gemmatimonadaceae bacterium]
MTSPAQNETRDLSTRSIVVAAKDQVSSDLGGETILLSMENAMYYGLDEVGSRIWELVREPVRVSDIRDVIADEYDVDVDRCEADVLAFLREMIAKGLVQIADGAEPAR